MSEVKHTPGVLRQILRGCGHLPHVGEHPGTAMLLVLLLLGGLAGSGGGLWGCLGGVAIMGSFAIPAYLYGAYGRAQESDRITAASTTGSAS